MYVLTWVHTFPEQKSSEKTGRLTYRTQQGLLGEHQRVSGLAAVSRRHRQLTGVTWIYGSRYYVVAKKFGEHERRSGW